MTEFEVKIFLKTKKDHDEEYIFQFIDNALWGGGFEAYVTDIDPKYTLEVKKNEL